MRRGPLAFSRARSATSAVEFAIMLPVLLLLLASTVEIGRLAVAYESVNRLATRYAISWADCSDTVVGVCATELALYVTPAAVQNMAPQIASSVTLRMMEVQMSGASATVVYAYPAAATPTATELTLAQNVIGSGNTGIIVTTSYTYAPQFFTSIVKPFLGSGRAISYTIAQRKA